MSARLAGGTRHILTGTVPRISSGAGAPVLIISAHSPTTALAWGCLSCAGPGGAASRALGRVPGVSESAGAPCRGGDTRRGRASSPLALGCAHTKGCLRCGEAPKGPVGDVGVPVVAPWGPVAPVSAASGLPSRLPARYGAGCAACKAWGAARTARDSRVLAMPGDSLFFFFSRAMWRARIGPKAWYLGCHQCPQPVLLGVWWGTGSLWSRVCASAPGLWGAGRL